jgi:hypothetical protein
MVSRETIHAALFDRIREKVPGFLHYSRVYQDFDSVPQQPALLVVADKQIPEQQPNVPTKWRLRAFVILYARNTDPTKPAETVLNEAIDQVVGALQPQPGENGEGHTTLGGLCQRAWVSGPIDLYQGIPGEQSVAIVPVEILAI